MEIIMGDQSFIAPCSLQLIEKPQQHKRFCAIRKNFPFKIFLVGSVLVIHLLLKTRQPGENMPISPDLLEILCCPRSKVPVRMLSEEQLSTLNGRIETGDVKYQDDSTIEKPLQEGLITEDGETVYRVEEGIPIMLVEQGIPLT
jgi:uncharacterized protein YbaR (Trm112 family)